MDTIKFSYGKRAIFREIKEIKWLRGGVHHYAAQVSVLIDAEGTGKDRKSRTPGKAGGFPVVLKNLGEEILSQAVRKRLTSSCLLSFFRVFQYQIWE